MNNNEYCEIVMRQTDYDIDMAKKKLVEHNNNIEAVVREFMNPPVKKEIKKTLNQQIFTEIRGLMDEASNNYRHKKEMEEKNEILKKRKISFIIHKIVIIQKYARRFLVKNKS